MAKVFSKVELNSINFINKSERSGDARSLFWPWAAANVSFLALSYGSFFLGFGISFWQATLAAIIGTLGSFALVAISSLAGKRSNAPTMTLSRAAFGVKGNRLPGFLSYLIFVGWETVLVSLATLASETVFTRVGNIDPDLSKVFGFLLAGGLTIIGKGWNVRLNGGSAQLVYRRSINYEQQTDSLRLKEIEWSEQNHSKILEICTLLADRKKTHNMTLKAAYKQLQRRIKWIIERNSSFAVSTFASSEVKLHDIKNYCLMARRWAGVISRCHDPTDPNFYAYGARGISVCEEWFNFDNFLRFWQAPPFDGAQFGRINNDGNYEPSNCEWQDQTACRYLM